MKLVMELHPDYKLRSATNEDSEQIKNLIFGILREYKLNPDPVTTDFDLNDISANYLNKNGIFDLIVDSAGCVIATTGLYQINEKTCELRKMYLLKEHREKGLGKFLLEHSLKRARELGYKKVILETASVLKEAIGLYEKYGFKKFQSDHLSNRCDQSYYLNLE